jgi:hypothetical protein
VALLMKSWLRRATRSQRISAQRLNVADGSEWES